MASGVVETHDTRLIRSLVKDGWPAWRITQWMRRDFPAPTPRADGQSWPAWMMLDKRSQQGFFIQN